MGKSDFPQRVELGSRTQKYFRASDIDDWVAKLDQRPSTELTEKVKSALQNSTKYVEKSVTP